MVSGTPPGTTGTGRFISYLMEQGATLICSAKLNESHRKMLREYRVFSVVWAVTGYFIGKFIFYIRLWWLRTQENKIIVLLHPQFIGMERTIQFIQNSRSEIYLYLLDNGYFCIRSYNHLSGANSPCMDCIGGNFKASKIHQCKSGPIKDRYAQKYVSEMYKFVQEGRVKVIAQCQTQAKIAKHHFGIEIPVSGLWAKDWDHVFDNRAVSKPGDVKWDVVYHGVCVEAKGVFWLLEVAALCPSLQFLFPFHESWLKTDPPKNCTFRDMRWETGLQEEIEASPVVAVPSLWSAPIEGALVKSIVKGKAVAVVDSGGKYSREIPENLLLMLPEDPGHAAEILINAVQND